jgi:hypothetical protein
MEKTDENSGDLEENIDQFLFENADMKMFSRLDIFRYLVSKGLPGNLDDIQKYLKELCDGKTIVRVESIPFYSRSEHMEDLAKHGDAKKSSKTVITYKVKKETLWDFEESMTAKSLEN